MLKMDNAYFHVTLISSDDQSRERVSSILMSRFAVNLIYVRIANFTVGYRDALSYAFQHPQALSAPTTDNKQVIIFNCNSF